MKAPLQVSRGSTMVPSFTLLQTNLLQRKCACGQHTVAGGECAECRQKREGMMQHSAVSVAPVNGVLPVAHEVLNSAGQPLDAGTRTFVEPRFGHDFSRVKIFAGDGDKHPKEKATPSGTPSVAPAAPVPRLTKTVGELGTGDCGEASWIIQWILTNLTTKGGWVVQKVAAAFDGRDCNEKPVDVKSKFGGQVDPAWFPYWEAWPINKNQKVTTYAEGGDKQDDTYSMISWGDNTKGTWSFTGTAEFYEGLTLPKDFTVTNKPPTGILPRTRTAPKLAGGTGTIAHNFVVKWNCCPQGKDKTIDRKTTTTKT